MVQESSSTLALVEIPAADEESRKPTIIQQILNHDAICVPMISINLLSLLKSIVNILAFTLFTNSL